MIELTLEQILELHTLLLRRPAEVLVYVTQEDWKPA